MAIQEQLPLEARNEPVLQPPADHPPQQDARAGDVCAEILRITGKKVSRDDPIVLAALIQSSLLEQAGTKAALSVHTAAVEATQTLAAAYDTSRQRLETIDTQVAAALLHLCEASRKIGDQECAAMSARFARTAADTLAHVRTESATQSPQFRRWQLATAFVVGLAIGLAASVQFSAARLAALSADETRLMHNGALLDAAWPQLPAASRRLFAGDPLNAPKDKAATQAASTKEKRK